MLIRENFQAIFFSKKYKQKSTSEVVVSLPK